jgi:copper chaperone CopZ
MTCESCIQDISGSLYKLGGIQKVEANLKDQLVTIEGTGSSHCALPKGIGTVVGLGTDLRH